MKVNFVQSGRGYFAFVNGEKVGEVWKNERHYNLRRPFTMKGWSARTVDGTYLKIDSDLQIFQTRKEATQALSEEIADVPVQG